MSPHPRVGREHILDIAEKLFTEHGYKSASIRAIASECGVTNAAIYYHFPDKESLFAEVMQRHADNLREKMTIAGENIDFPREKLIAILKAYINTIAGQHAPIFMLRKDAKHLKKHGQHRAIWIQRVSQPLVKALQFAQEKNEIKTQPKAEEAASMLLGMLHGLAQQRRCAGIEGRAILEDDIEMVVNLFWEGIEKQ
ncbi:MAG: TetR/AcrR family transcriptional regulator [Anaerolineae bacterium]|jgi:AcrR family transcriptional regulator|nr:TetR/AcrR family transcriptional regulator [Anaerolineae bacterium]MBT7073443.1 TetR/AcrR family transcriptional regulator [Anaerolineae bacterium]MBT7781816.1 TetR/AcrR family transcriptional regulator [Anaerolineae bacterium]